MTALPGECVGVSESRPLTAWHCHDITDSTPRSGIAAAHNDGPKPTQADERRPLRGAQTAP